MTNIYALIDPRTKEIRYIGKSNNPEYRLKQHLKRDVILCDNHRTRWIRQLLLEKLQPILVILEKVPSSEWQIHEKKWIKKYRILGFNLTNSTDGGDGIENPSKETRLKISNNSRNRSNETLRKIGMASKKLWQNPQYRQYMIDCAKNISDKTRQKMSETAKNRPKEMRKRQAAKMKGRHLTEEHKKKISEGCKRTYIEEHRAAVTESNRTRIHTKESRRKHSEYKKAYWINKKLNQAITTMEYNIKG